MNTRIIREISLEWERLMKVASAVDYGELRVLIQSGKPVRVESAIKQIKLDSDNEEFKKDLETIPLA